MIERKISKRWRVPKIVGGSATNGYALGKSRKAFYSKSRRGKDFME